MTVSALVAAAWARWRRGQPLASALRDVGAIAVYPAVAVAGFAIFSRVVVGAWFVGSDFFVPENKALGDPVMAAAEIGWGAQTLSGTRARPGSAASASRSPSRSAWSAASAPTR